MNVAPLAGAWIEIAPVAPFSMLALPSLPSRERGLKFALNVLPLLATAVAPLAGAWIEILPLRYLLLLHLCRSPRGSVD